MKVSFSVILVAVFSCVLPIIGLDLGTLDGDAESDDFLHSQHRGLVDSIYFVPLNHDEELQAWVHHPTRS